MASLSLQKNDAHPTTRTNIAIRNPLNRKLPIALEASIRPYTCEPFEALSETDIEHIVARSEAHDSGLCAASQERKREFASDIRNLTLSAPDLNRNVKGAKDAADWTPDENRCWFAWPRHRRSEGLWPDH